MANNEPMTAPMTAAEAGAILGVSPRTVQRLTESGELTVWRKLPGPNGDYLYESSVVWNLAAKREKAKAASA